MRDDELINVGKLTSFEALEAFVEVFEEDLLGGNTKPWPPEARARVRGLANRGLTRILEIAREDATK